MTSTIPDSDAAAHRAAGGWFHFDDVCVTDDGHTGHLHSFSANATALAELVAEADPTTPVTWCPGWDLTALAAHVGATHRWVTAMITGAATSPERFRPFLDAAPGGPQWAGAAGGPELAAWLAGGARELRSAFDVADPDAEVWTWTDQRQVRYWSRRMLFELLVHLSDARAATGAPVRLHAALAAEGVHEVLDIIPALTARGQRPDPGPEATFALAAPDARTVWIVTGNARDFTWRTVETEHTEWAPPPAMRAADAALTGDATDVLLWLWGRDTGRLELEGDTGILDRWRAATKI